jgi:O-antigen/teichoic acid export membrane protein
MGAVLSKWLIAEGKLWSSVIRHWVGAILNVGANLLLIPVYGLTGAAVATVLSYAAANYVALFFTRATWGPAASMTKALAAPVRIVISRTRQGR